MLHLSFSQLKGKNDYGASTKGRSTEIFKKSQIQNVSLWTLYIYHCNSFMLWHMYVEPHLKAFKNTFINTAIKLQLEWIISPTKVSSIGTWQLGISWWQMKRLVRWVVEHRCKKWKISSCCTIPKTDWRLWIVSWPGWRRVLQVKRRENPCSMDSTWSTLGVNMSYLSIRGQVYFCILLST